MMSSKRLRVYNLQGLHRVMVDNLKHDVQFPIYPLRRSKILIQFGAPEDRIIPTRTVAPSIN